MSVMRVLSFAAALAIAAAAYAQPANDNCGSAIHIENDSVTAFNTTTATTDGVTTCGFNTVKDVWYTFTAGNTAVFTASTCGSSFDTVVSIYDGCGGNLIACNDDACTGLSSSVSANLTIGQVVWIRVAGYNGQSGTGDLSVHIDPQVNDACAGAITVGEASVTPFDTRGTSTDGTSSCGFNNGHDVWYKFICPTAGTLTASCCDANFDSLLAFYNGSCAGAELSCNDDFCGLRSTTSATVAAGQTIIIRVCGYFGASGRGNLTIDFASSEWIETGDAGDRPVNAQIPLGRGALTSITGSTNNELADMYRIVICDEANFSASLVNAVTGTQDTQLFLFDSSGDGVQMNDDSSALVSAFGSQFVASNGTYFIAVSHYDADPVNSAGQEIWADQPFTGVRAPDGPNGGNTHISGWNGPVSTFAYRLDLTGTCYFPCEADFNHDRVIDFFDYLDFVQAFSAGSSSADFNHDQVVDFFDYLDFLQSFSAGC